MSDSKRLILKGFFYTAIGLVISKIFTYAWRIIAARIGVEEYGSLSLVMAMFSILAPIALLGLNEATMRYVSYYEGLEQRSRIISAILNNMRYVFAFSIIFYLIIFLSSDFIASNIFHDPGLSPLIRIFSLFFPLISVGKIAKPLFNIYDRMDYHALIAQIIEPTVKILLTLTLIYFGLGIEGVTFAHVAAMSLTSVLYMIYSNKRCINYLKGLNIEHNDIREHLWYGIPLIFTGIASVIFASTDSIMLGLLSGVEQVGIYNAAYPTANLLLIVPMAMLAVFMPVITKDYARKRYEEIKRNYIFVIKWIFLINFFALLVLFTYSDNILQILFGNEYMAGSAVLKILSVAIFIKAMFFSSSNSMINMLKETRLTMKIIMFASVFNIFANYLLIQYYGIIGASIATLLSILLLTSIFIYVIKDRFGILPLHRDIIISAVSSLIAFNMITELMRYLFGYFDLFTGFVSVVLSGISYLLILYLLGIINFKEFEVLRKYFFR